VKSQILQEYIIAEDTLRKKEQCQLPLFSMQSKGIYFDFRQKNAVFFKKSLSFSFLTSSEGPLGRFGMMESIGREPKKLRG
jgi:hypothetical protein